MNLQEIKTAIDNGQRVFWSNGAYEVKKSKSGELNIICSLNGHCIGLTWVDGETLNGKEQDFFILYEEI